MRIVTTKSINGITFNGLLSEPNSTPKGIIIHVHGMAGSIVLNSYYQPMHERYPQDGWAFLVGEHRGTGVVTQLNSDKGFITTGNAYEIFEECVLDIQSWVDFAKELGYKKIWIQAHSLGPSKVVYYMTKSNEPSINGLIWISPSDMVGLLHSETGIDDHNLLLKEAKQLVQENKPKQILSNLLWGENMMSAQTYISLFDEDTKNANFNYVNKELGWGAVNSIKVPVLAITGTEDIGIAPIIDPYIAMGLLESQLLNSPRKKTIVYNGAKHSFNRFENNIVDDVLKFINS